VYVTRRSPLLNLILNTPHSTSTVTSTDTISTVTETPDLFDKRTANLVVTPQPATVVPTSIPAYASPCSGSVRYSSACSCIGVTATTTTAPTPTYIVTQTATAVATVIPASLPFTAYTNQYCEPSGITEQGLFIQNQCFGFTYSFPGFDIGTLRVGTCANGNTCRVGIYSDDACQDLNVSYGVREIATSCSPGFPYSIMLTCNC
jgi:hypothetical protein